MNLKLNLTAGLLLALVLAACGSPQAQSTPTVNPETVLTAAAQTASARMTEIAQITPSPLPATPTFTITPTQLATTAAPTTALTSIPVQTGIDKLNFVADLTVPDGTAFKPGESFVKTWRLINEGTTTWTSAYSLVFFDGSQMSGQSPTPLTLQVAPGATLDISVNLVAPTTTGSHTGFWMLRNAAGKNFGLGPNADQPFYVQINVDGSAATATTGASTTPGAATSTATPAAAEVTDPELSVDTANFAGSCPHTFNFTIQFDLNKESSVTYQLEAETGFPITLPSPTTVTLSSGTHSLTYALEFTGSFTGWARFYVSAPNEVRSSQVNLSLTCQ